MKRNVGTGIISKAGIHCSSSSRSSIEEPKGLRKNCSAGLDNSIQSQQDTREERTLGDNGMRTLLFLPSSISTREGLSKPPGFSILARETEEEEERKDEEIPNACAQVASKRLYIRNAAVVRWLHTLSNNGNEMNQTK